MRPTNTSRFTVALTLLAATVALAGWSKTGDAKANFTGKGPAGFKIEGTTKALDVKDDGTTLTVIVALKDLETGIALRDNHMRNKYIEVDKFPEATLAVKLADLKEPADGKTASGSAKGTFTLHGVSKDASFKYVIACKGSTCKVKGEAEVNFNKHGIKVPSYMGITVKPDIKVGAEFQLKKG